MRLAAITGAFAFCGSTLTIIVTAGAIAIFAGTIFAITIRAGTVFVSVRRIFSGHVKPHSVKGGVIRRSSYLYISYNEAQGK